MRCPQLLMTVLPRRRKNKPSSTQKHALLHVIIQPSVDSEDAEDVRRGGGSAHGVESEGRARDGLQLGAFLQAQQAGHLAGLDEVEGVWPGGRGRRVALDALQLLRPVAAGHHVQLYIRSLLLVEQHLKRHRGR